MAKIASSGSIRCHVSNRTREPIALCIDAVFASHSFTASRSDTSRCFACCCHGSGKLKCASAGVEVCFLTAPPACPLKPRSFSRSNRALCCRNGRATLKDGSTFAPFLNGCWTLAGGHGRVDPQQYMQVMERHAEAGFTTFDTADIYGPSERVLGAFRASWNAKHPDKPIEIFTKLVPNIFQQRPTKQSVEAAIERSCAALGMTTLDMVQLHWWDYSIPGMTDVGKWLAELKLAGKIKHVAVTNMDCNALQQLLDAGVPVVSNQVQFSLLDRRPLNGMVDLCAKHDIKLLTYGTLGGGLLTDRYVAAPSQGLLGAVRYPPIDLNTSSLKMYYSNVRYGGEKGWRDLLTTLRTIADSHGVTVAAVSLRWAMDAGKGLVFPIVGMRNDSHMQDNASAFALKLSANAHALITEALRACPGPSGDIYSNERA